MTVTSVEHVSRSKTRICLDGEAAFTVSDKILASWGLEIKPDTLLSESEEELLMKEAGRLASRCAMDHLVRRDYAENELYRLLLRQGFSPELAARAMAYVCSYGYIDDERFAGQFIESRRGSMSRRMIICKLKEKGISDDIISRQLEDKRWSNSEAACTELFKRCRCGTVPLTGSAEYQKLCRSLQNKGYSYSDILSAFSRLRDSQAPDQE